MDSDCVRSHAVYLANGLYNNHIHVVNKVGDFWLAQILHGQDLTSFIPEFPAGVQNPHPLIVFVSRFTPKHAVLSKKYQSHCQNTKEGHSVFMSQWYV